MRASPVDVIRRIMAGGEHVVGDGGIASWTASEQRRIVTKLQTPTGNAGWACTRRA